MIGIPQEITRLMRRKNHSEKSMNIIYTLMTHFHQPYSEIIKLPIPVAIEMLKRLEKENKELKKGMKKNGK